MAPRVVTGDDPSMAWIRQDAARAPVPDDQTGGFDVLALRMPAMSSFGKSAGGTRVDQNARVPTEGAVLPSDFFVELFERQVCTICTICADSGNQFTFRGLDDL